MKSIFCHKVKAVPPAANTLRFEFSDPSYSPVTAGVGSSGTWKKCDWFPGNVWDWSKSGTSFSNAFNSAFTDSDNIVSVIDVGNTSAVTIMDYMFRNCSSLKSVTLFDTSSVVNLSAMFSNCTSLKNIPLFDTSSAINMSSFLYNCTSLKSIPLFDTSVATNVYSAFRDCINVEGGALALYQQMSTQANPPSTHDYTFSNCGRDTVSGAAELAQIPTSWGGTKEDV